MALNPSDKKLLEEIVNADGMCLDSKRCPKCPFRAACLPEFLTKEPLSQSQRFNKALDVLSHNYLVDDDMTVDEVQQDYTWQER